LDAVQGNIVARNGNRLSVKGAFAVRHDRVARVHRTVTVDVGASTNVIKTGVSGAMDPNALSVGQHIVAFGTLTEPAEATAPAVLDATNGRVRLLPTSLHGAVSSVVPGQLNLRLSGIDRLGVEAFDFTGTGITLAQDAVPSDYEVATGTLTLAGIAPGEAVRVLGFVRPFGAAPADFEGRTVVDHRDLHALLSIGWGGSGTSAPFASMGGSGLVLDLENPSIGARHGLFDGARQIDLLTLATPPTVAPPAAGRALFGLTVGSNVRLFATFAEFTSELATLLGGGHAALALTASGTFDEASATLRATRVVVHLAAH
jgi:hypothetical protein